VIPDLARLPSSLAREAGLAIDYAGFGAFFAPQLTITRSYRFCVERRRRQLLVRCYRMLVSLTNAEDEVKETLLCARRYRDSVKEDAPLRSWLLPRGHEHLPRLYICGVVPSIVRNIAMKALTLS
jgi:hypothetical protein